MRRSNRPFVWTAENCNYSDAEIYIGLAPGIEDARLREAFNEQVLARFPSREVPIVRNSHRGDTVTLRLYSLRDPNLCKVEKCSDASSSPGFHRVRLTFNPGNYMEPGNNEVDQGSDTLHEPAVVAFLLTIGLTPEQEQVFFNGVLTQFLEESWSNLPKLLHEIGCTTIADAA